MRISKNSNRLTFAGRSRSVLCALKGLAVLIGSQANAWIHATATLAVVLAGVHFGLNRSEWCWIIVAITAVWTAEALNTAIEFLTDLASPDYHVLAGKTKDVAAAGVLIAAAGAAAIGVLVFSPYVLPLP